MSDNFFATEFGTTVMGHLNLLSGQTHQTIIDSAAGTIANGSVIANINPVADDCTQGATVEMTSKRRRPPECEECHVRVVLCGLRSDNDREWHCSVR
jgi:hypothetical protein